MPDGFDPDDFDFDEEETDTDCCTVLRATFLRDGQIAMTPWMLGLAEGGPAGMCRRSRGTRRGVHCIADLRRVRSATGEREVIAEFMAGGRGRESAEASLCSWARGTGHTRVWLPSGPVDISPPDGLATATVRCPTFRATWTNGWRDLRRRIVHKLPGGIPHRAPVPPPVARCG